LTHLLGAAERRAAGAGGVVFVAALVISAFFSLMLFDLRSDKIFTLPASLDEASAEDIAAYWRAGRMALDGAAASTYDAEAFRAGLPPPNDGLLWLHPPHFLLLTAPLAALPYPAFKAFWTALSVLSLLASVRLTAAKPLFYATMLLSPAAFASLLAMQAGPVIAAGLAAALAGAERRPIIAGIVLAFLTMKPQYGLLAPVFLAAIGAWRAFAVAAIASAALMALSAAIFGGGVWREFFGYIFGGGLGDHTLLVHRDMVTINQTIGKLGGDAQWRDLAQIAAILVVGAAVYVTARRWRRNAAVGFTLLASAFVSPSLWIYDWPLVAAGLFMLARAASPWPVRLQLAAAALWTAPLISLGFTTMQSSLAAPTIFAATLAGFWLWGERLREAG
jgi:hypothetical protein